jgi:hypothetical protein
MPLNGTTLSVGVPDIGEDDSEEEQTAATAEGADEEEEDTGLAGEYQLCPGT